MKITFNRERMYWDDWRRFYSNLPGSIGVVFENGEVAITATARDDHLRHVYKAYNVQLIATTDPACPKLYLPDSDTPIPAAHLTDGGLQVLLIDWCTRRAVRLTYPPRTHGESDGWRAQIPVALRKRVTAYFPGEGMPPLGDPIKVSPPWKPTREEKEQIEANAAACKMWTQMEESEKNPEIAEIRTYHHKANAYCGIGPIDASALLCSFDKIPNNQRVQAADRGYTLGRDPKNHPYLIVKGEMA